MCGIVGIVGKDPVAQRLFDGLKRLEYRGYDSAGICTIDHGELARRRAEGKLENLARELASEPLGGTIGIAHTRWATHGAPTVDNAHPHVVGPVAITIYVVWWFITLVDAWGPGNARASSGGETRILRGTYGARAIYTRMAARAMRLWREHEERSERRFFHRIGALWMFGGDASFGGVGAVQHFVQQV